MKYLYKRSDKTILIALGLLLIGLLVTLIISGFWKHSSVKSSIVAVFVHILFLIAFVSFAFTKKELAFSKVFKSGIIAYLIGVIYTSGSAALHSYSLLLAGQYLAFLLLFPLYHVWNNIGWTTLAYLPFGLFVWAVIIRWIIFKVRCDR
jgi:hypothetical protein